MTVREVRAANRNNKQGAIWNYVGPIVNNNYSGIARPSIWNYVGSIVNNNYSGIARTVL